MYLPDFLQRLMLVVLQSLMVGCIGALVFKASKSLFDLATARIAIVVFLLNPWVYWNAKNPMTGILQALLYILFISVIGTEFPAIVKRLSENTRKMKLWAKPLVIGTIAAALALTHGTMLAVGFILLFILFLASIVWRNHQLVLTSIASTVLMVALVAPWTYRNWVVFNRFIPVVGGSGLGYFNGIIHWNNTIPEPQREGETHIDACFRVAGIEGTEETHTHWKGMKDIEIEDEINKKAIEHLREHPTAFVKKIMLNSIEYYFPAFTYSYLAVKCLNVEHVALTGFHLVLWILVVVGIWRDKKGGIRLQPAWLLLAAICFYTVWYIPFSTFIGHSLYTLGTMPLLSILVARGVKFFEEIGSEESY
jgi:4-amino-4-deoxy-L-arabinose transferase-like glycosyltransferase